MCINKVMIMKCDNDNESNVCMKKIKENENNNEVMIVENINSNINEVIMKILMI